MIIEREVDTYQSSVTHSTATQTEVKLVNNTAVVESKTLSKKCSVESVYRVFSMTKKSTLCWYFIVTTAVL